MELLRDLNKDTVDFSENYDGQRKEPVVLPSRFPNILVNGNMGIAGGDGGDGYEVIRVTGNGMFQWSYYNAKVGKSVVYNGTTYTGGGIYGASDFGHLNYNNVTIGVVAGGGGSGGASAGNNSAHGNSSRIYGSQ